MNKLGLEIVKMSEPGVMDGGDILFIGVGTVGAPGARAPPTLPGIYIYGECKGS